MPCSPGTSSLFQSSSGGGPPTKPVNSARPGAELERRIFVVPSASVNSYVLTLSATPTGQASKTNRGVGPGSTGRGQAVAISENRATIGRCVVDRPGPPWHWAQARTNTALPCCSRGVSGGSGSGSGLIPTAIAFASDATPGLLNNV